MIDELITNLTLLTIFASGVVCAWNGAESNLYKIMKEIEAKTGQKLHLNWWGTALFTAIPIAGGWCAHVLFLKASNFFG